MEESCFPVYVINLKKRTDRRDHIIRQFSGRTEFDLTIFEAIEHEVGAIGLWKSILQIINNLVTDNQPYIILCEDDHEFTSAYSSEFLGARIEEAEKLEADVLLGGVSWMNSMIPVSDNLYWVEGFTGLQFTVVFRRFFKKILDADFQNGDAADFTISDLSKRKHLVYPFISIQKGFDYSDVTPRNNREGRVSELFEATDERAKLVTRVRDFYAPGKWNIEDFDEESIETFLLPTYVLLSPNIPGRKEEMESRFLGRNEFMCSYVAVEKNESPQVGLWLTIRKCIETAVANEEDVIVICDDNHNFTSDYSKKYLFSNLLEAHQQGMDILVGGVGGYGVIVPITQNRHWISECLHSKFYVIFSKFYDTILNEPFDSEINVDLLLSELTSNKNLLFPFISIPGEFDLRGKVTEETTEDLDLMNSNRYKRCNNKLQILQDAFVSFQS